MSPIASRRALKLSVTDPIQLAFDRTGKVLFKPFDLGKWFVLGFCAFLAYLGEESGFQFNWSRSVGTSAPGGSTGRTPGQWLLGELHWLAPLALGLLLTGLAVLAVLAWLNSRGKFLFIAAVANDRAAVVEPWKQYRRRGNSLFRFRLLVLLLAVAVALVTGAAALLISWGDLLAGQLTGAGVGAIVLAAGTLTVVLLGYLLITLVVEDFLAPAMYARQLAVGPAWTLLRQEVFAGNLGLILLFYLMRLLISFVIAMVTFVAMCLTCCLAAVPYLGTVILLPLIVFQRCYSLYFLQQFGGRWRIFARPEDQPPTCPACGYDLRGNPAATHCPECGSELPGERPSRTQPAT